MEHVTQQEQLYVAEREAPTGRTFASQADIQQYLLDDLMVQPWWERRFPHIETILCPTVKRRPGTGSVGGIESPGIGVIEMAEVHWCEKYVLHEVAHVVTEETSTGHDPIFARTYLGLVFSMMGTEAWMDLRNSFVRHGICFDERCQELPKCWCK